MTINSSDLLHFAEGRALNQIEGLANLDDGMITRGQVIERISEINSKMDGFDLIIQSETFALLAKATRTVIPRVNDRILTGIERIIAGVKSPNKDCFELIEKSTKILTDWDENLKAKAKEDLEYLKKYTKIDHFNKLKDFTIELIKKYHFESAQYAAFIKSDRNNDSHIDSDFEATLPFIDRVGPLISIYESIKNESDFNKAQIDVTLSLLKYYLDLIGLKPLYIVDLIPTQMRAVVRRKGYKEEQVLTMPSHLIVQLCKEDSIGVILIELAKMISLAQENDFIRSRTGVRLYSELKQLNFWNAIEYQPRLALLQHTNRASSIENVASKYKSTSRIGFLKSLLYNRNNKGT